MRPIPTCALALLAVLGSVSPAPGRTTERDLAWCPTLLPLRPARVTDPELAACRSGVADASRRYLDRLLESYQACLARMQRGELSGTPQLVCRGALFPSRRQNPRNLPTDPATALAVFTAAVEFAEGLGAACGDAEVEALDLCGDDVDSLRACLNDALLEHAHDALDAQYGVHASIDAFQPIDDPATQGCQDAVATAGRSYLAELQSAVAGCLAAEPRWPWWWPRRWRPEPWRRCVGAVWWGWRFPPLDRSAAQRIRDAADALSARVAASCGGAEAAALDACGSDPTSLADCLLCSHHREALYAIGDAFGGEPPRRSRRFVDWGRLANPVLAYEAGSERFTRAGRPFTALQDRMLKDQAVVYRDGWFYVFASHRLEPSDPDPVAWFFRTRDFLDWELLEDENGELNGPNRGPASPDVVKLGDDWHLVEQQGLPVDPDRRQLFLSLSRNLLAWSASQRLTPGSSLGENLIDGALAEADGFFYLGFKDRDEQRFYVTRSEGPVLDGRWLPRRRAFAGGASSSYFAENFQFAKLDGVWRMIATGRDPEPRCARPEILLNTFVCSNEPFVYTLDGDGSDLEHWTRWIRRRHLRVPYEDWNPAMHANSAFLADWRRYDGFFYLFYAGSLDGTRFDRRGHGKLGVVRSRDLVHWRLPGDLRD